MVTYNHKEMKQQYEYYLLYKKSALGVKSFCREHNLDCRKLEYFIKKYDYKSNANPARYKQEMIIANDFLQKRKEYYKTNRKSLTYEDYINLYKPNVPLYILKAAYIHLEYRKYFDENCLHIKSDSEPKPKPEKAFTFVDITPEPEPIPIPNLQVQDLSASHPKEDDFLPANNALTLTIKSGITVTIESNIADATVTKLITLLRSL